MPSCPAVRRSRSELPSTNSITRNGFTARRDASVVNADDRGMLNAGHDLGFALEARQGLPSVLAEQLGANDLDRDLTLQSAVERSVDAPHATNAEGGSDRQPPVHHGTVCVHGPTLPAVPSHRKDRCCSKNTGIDPRKRLSHRRRRKRRKEKASSRLFSACSASSVAQSSNLCSRNSPPRRAATRRRRCECNPPLTVCGSLPIMIR